MKRILFISSLILLAAVRVSGAGTITSEQARLVGDGVTLNTDAFQKAIDRLSDKGGGTLVLLPGRYLTGTVELKSGVELRLERGAELLGSTNPADYADKDFPGGTHRKPLIDLELALITANGARNVKLSGDGVINGQGRALALHIDSLHYKGIAVSPDYDDISHRPNHRPVLLSLRYCSNVEISGLRFTASSIFALEFYKCEDVNLHHLDVLNRAYWNNDGIDIIDCKRMEVAFCHVNSADDGICLNTWDPDDTTDGIYIHDCTVESSASALKCGTPSYGCFQNLHFARIKVKNTFRSAIALEAVDGGSLKSILAEDIEAFNVGNPIFIRLGRRNGNRTASVDGITIRRMYCETAFERPDGGYDIRGPITNTMINPIPSSITGIPGHKVRNVNIEDVILVYPGGASKGLRYIPTWDIARVPEFENHYPDYDMFGELPAYGFFVRHAEGIRFRNVNLKLKEDDFRPAFVLSDTENVSFDSISYPLGKTEGQIYMDN